jgi:RND family efflux transporter MFP subunit
MKKWLLAIALAAVLSVVGLAYVHGDLQLTREHKEAAPQKETSPAKARDDVGLPVSVAVVEPALFVETVMVTGSLVPREEIIIAAEIEGQRIVSLSAEEGDYVKAGDLLATLEDSTLRAQQAQNDAAIARADAAIAQAQSLIVEANARLDEAEANLERAKPLRASGHISQAIFDQREAAARTARAQATSAKNGLALAEAEKNQAEAQGRELEWRLSKTEIRAPVSGLISRRTARIGGLVSSTRDPLFLIIADAEIELDAEVPEAKISRLKIGQTATISASGGPAVTGTVRLISPEVDKASRLGHVRIFLGANPDLRVGAFARGTVETSRTTGLAVPQSAVLYQTSDNSQRAYVQRIKDNRIETVEVEIGSIASGLMEITSGLEEGDVVVAKSGTFLRNGDIVRPITPAPKVSEAGR